MTMQIAAGISGRKPSQSVLIAPIAPAEPPIAMIRCSSRFMFASRPDGRSMSEQRKASAEPGCVRRVNVCGEGLFREELRQVRGDSGRAAISVWRLLPCRRRGRGTTRGVVEGARMSNLQIDHIPAQLPPVQPHHPSLAHRQFAPSNQREGITAQPKG
jgi:hypothetical protein